MQTLYQEYKHLLLIEGIRQDAQKSYLLYLHKNRKGALTLWEPSWWEVGKHFLRMLLPLNKTQILFFWSSLQESPLDSFLSSAPLWLFKETNLFKNPPKEAAGYLQNLKSLTAESDLKVRSHCFTRQRLRPHSPMEERVRENLSLFYPPAFEPLPSPKADPQQILEGEVNFSSGNLELSFKKGVLLGWHHLRKKLPPLPKARNYSQGTVLKNCEHHGFSIEQGNLTGLRQVLFSGGSVSSFLDYFPLENENAFLINGSFTWDVRVLASGEKVILAPLELPLYQIEKNTSLKVTVLASDGDNYERHLADDECQDILWGESFFFHHPSCPLMISFPSQEEAIKFPLSIQIKRIKKHFCLILNLGGLMEGTKLEKENPLCQTFSIVLTQPTKTPFQPLFLPFVLKKEIFPIQIWQENHSSN